MNSSFFAEDPWENGWTDRSIETGRNSDLMLPAVDHNDSHHPHHDSDPTDEVSVLLKPLVDAHKLTAYQTRVIRGIVYDHSLYPVSDKTNFDQICGLIALELDGTGADYTTLQMRRGNVTLDDSIMQLLRPSTNPINDDKSHSITLGLHSSTIDDPLTSNLDQSVLASSMLSEHRDKLDGGENNTINSDDIDDNDANVFINSIRQSFRLVANPSVTIKEVPEREGLIFKHINYVVSTSKAKVLRRYSDFVWLLEVLLHKYPCRVIPGLPPKKFSGMLIYSIMCEFTVLSNKY